MSKSLSKFITTNPKSLLFIFVVALIFSLFNLDNFKLDASSDSLVLESDDDLKYYREVNSDYSSSDFLIVIFDPDEDLFSEKTVAQVREMVTVFENIDGVEISANLKLESGDSNALNLINGNAYEEAINYLEGMNNRSDADTLNLAICYEAIGDKIQSIRFYENAAKMNSSYKSNYEDAKKRLNL